MEVTREAYQGLLNELSKAQTIIDDIRKALDAGPPKRAVEVLEKPGLGWSIALRGTGCMIFSQDEALDLLDLLAGEIGATPDAHHRA